MIFLSFLAWPYNILDNILQNSQLDHYRKSTIYKNINVQIIKSHLFLTDCRQYMLINTVLQSTQQKYNFTKLDHYARVTWFCSNWSLTTKPTKQFYDKLVGYKVRQLSNTLTAKVIIKFKHDSYMISENNVNNSLFQHLFQKYVRYVSSTIWTWSTLKWCS